MSEDARRSSGSLGHLLGTWYLVPADLEEIPAHRVEFVFYDDGPQIRGALVSRANGQHIPLPYLDLDETMLRLQLPIPGQDGGGHRVTPTLVLTLTNGTFQGYWQDAGAQRLGFALKLVKASDGRRESA